MVNSWEYSRKFLILSLIVLLPSPSRSEFLCPMDNATIAPCYCFKHPAFPATVECLGLSVTQSTLDNLFVILRSSNGLSENGTMEVPTLHIESTNLTQIDITPFLSSTFNLLGITSNMELTTFVGPTGGTKELELFGVTQLVLNENALREEGVGQLLEYLDVNMTTALYLKGNRLDGSPSADGSEFIPGLWSLTELQTLSLSANRIERVGRGQFRYNGRLTSISFGMNENERIEVGEDAFLIDLPQGEEAEEWLKIPLSIDLSYNFQMDETYIDELSGFGSSGRPIMLDISWCNFKTLPREKFESFLMENPLNDLYGGYNTFVCDNRMKWLKDGRAEFKSRVRDIDCDNDPGFNVFTTSLID